MAISAKAETTWVRKIPRSTWVAGRSSKVRTGNAALCSALRKHTALEVAMG